MLWTWNARYVALETRWGVKIHEKGRRLSCKNLVVRHIGHVSPHAGAAFSCDVGYTSVGSRKRVCLPIGYWDGLPAFCKRK